MSLEPVQLSLLDSYFADFIVRITDGAGDHLWLAAAMASAFSARGHVCLYLPAVADCEIKPARPEDELLRFPPADVMRDALRVCGSVGAPGQFTPLVLDSEDRLYLHRSWGAERRVAAGILSRCSSPLLDDTRLAVALDRYFPGGERDGDLQRTAAESAIRSQFAVISGGPGTGKTTTVARIMALLVDTAGGEPCRILLAAPTGKAAMRLQQSLATVYGRLSLPDELHALLPHTVSTVHRLLGVTGSGRGGRHNADNPLPCDVLVVDEASMIDLPLMAVILEALPAAARVILLGDRDQLASVEAGAVLADICAGGEGAVPSVSRPVVVQLTKSYRFRDDSGIGLLSRYINTGDADGAFDLLTSGRYPDVCWRPLPETGSFGELFSAVVAEGYAAFAHTASPLEALSALESFRVLVPHREGRHGVAGLNRLVEAALNTRRAGAVSYKPVMVGANNYDLGLFNGDTGVESLEPDGETTVFFPVADGADVRQLSTLRLPYLEAAYTLTVHKSQGSEYDSVLLILPETMSGVLSRELLYTAVTRARHRVEIWCGQEIFKSTVERRIERYSGLQSLLWNRNVT